jgi:hypothetical protein
MRIGATQMQTLHDLGTLVGESHPTAATALREVDTGFDVVLANRSGIDGRQLRWFMSAHSSDPMLAGLQASHGSVLAMFRAPAYTVQGSLDLGLSLRHSQAGFSGLDADAARALLAAERPV